MRRPPPRRGLRPPPASSRPVEAPLSRAQNDDLHQRQAAIADYERRNRCRLVVFVGDILPGSVTMLAECLHDVVGDQELHMLLWSLGGDPDVAVRLARMAQSASGELDVVVLVPDVAKSAATVLTLGADRIVMGPTSDLGPIDPQIRWGEHGMVSAKDLIDGVARAVNEVDARPNTAGLFAQMLAGLDVRTLEFAHSMLDQTEDIARQALRCSRHRSAESVEEMLAALRVSLVDEPDSHTAVIGASEAAEIGLPVHQLGHTDPQWQALWSLWTRYLVLGPPELLVVHESTTTSFVELIDPPLPEMPAGPP
jgi:ClpP class serine protease